MKIIALSIKGVRLISALEMEFTDKGIIPIKGPNRNGKTTILDSVQALLEGRTHFTPDMIKHGEDKAVIEGKITDGKNTYTIKRVIREGGKATLKITNQDGLKLADKPETFLKGLVNNLTFDPRPFLDKKDEDKLKFMMGILNIGFTKEDAKIKILSDSRAAIGRDIKRMGEIDPVAEVVPVDITKLLKMKKDAEDFNRARDKKINDRLLEISKAEMQLANSKEHLGRRIKELKDLQNKVKKAEVAVIKGEEYIHNLPVIPKPLKNEKYSDTEIVTEQISNAAITNESARAYEEYLKKTKAKEMLRQEYAKADAGINKVRLSKKKQLSKLHMPVKGLKIVIDEDGRDDGLYFEDIHCSNWSESEGMKISADLCLAMDPKLRALFIDRGEAYDTKSLQALDEWARANDLQAIITIVDDIPEESEPGVFYIQEGELV